MRVVRRLHLVLNSERTVGPVRQDGSYAEQQQSHRALLFLVHASAAAARQDRVPELL